MRPDPASEPFGEFLDVLWEDDELRFFRTWRDDPDGRSREFTGVVPTSESPSRNLVERLTREYGLRELLEHEWAARPLELVREHGRTLLLLEATRGLPLKLALGGTREIGRSLRMAVAMASAIGRMHQRGLVHKDIKPGNILVDSEEHIWITGFGIASRLFRERQSPDPPELIAGTLAYMAPEQTGRMNRSVDSRSDLYSFGVVLYELLTDSLPFIASDPMEWVHCHVAREPERPDARAHGVPSPVSAIIMKLLVKAPEQRYQTAAGVENDLRRCLVEWQTGGRIEAFPLGESDHPNRLIVPEKLYGRGREIDTLLSCFHEVVATGAPSLVLVAGYSGVGKSSVVNELHKVLVPPRALFAAGKFDQSRTNTPYATLAQAFQTLVRGLLTKKEAELRGLRDALCDALTPNAALLVELVPELALIIGDQPPVAELSAQEAKRRFRLLIRRFISVFARPEHPLALFLDDLQWLDTATLELLGDLVDPGGVPYLLLIGAYRDNEVNEQHPLLSKLDEMRQAGASVRTLTLLPLARHDLEDLLSDALRAPREHVRPLAELAHGKTGGNAFFVVQFLNSLEDEGLLVFDHQIGHWSWDEERVLAKGHSENVVELMLKKLGRLPDATRKGLMRLSCFGNAAEHASLAAACSGSREAVDVELWEALRQELVSRTGGGYRFSHDRVQEAAYALIPEHQRVELHLEIGRRLFDATPVERRKEAVFEIVNQLNRGAALIVRPEEREQLAQLDLLAGQRSKTSTAYASALEYLNAGLRWLPNDCWTRQRELSFSLSVARAECEYLTGDFAAAEQNLNALWAMDLTSVERAAVACLRIDLYVNLAQSGAAIAAGLDYLRHVGIDWVARPTAETLRAERDLVWQSLGERQTETLVDLPLMRNASQLGTLDVLITLTTPAWLVDPDLLFLVTCRAVNLSLIHGNCDASCVAYVLFGALSGPRFGDYQSAYGFSLLANRLGERPELRRFQARTNLFFGYLVQSWKKHLRVAREALWRSNQDANLVGNLTFAAISSRHISSNMLASGEPLEEVQRQIETSLEFATRRQLWLVVFTIIPQLGFTRSLRGLTPAFGSFDDGQIDEGQLEIQLASNEMFAVAECFHWIRKLQARYLAGDHAAAMQAALRAERLFWSATAQVEAADYHFFAALTRASCCDVAVGDELSGHRAGLAAHERQLSIWAEECPENFASPAALVAAEAARVAGRDLEAMRLYDRAVQAAEVNGFANNEALAYELAGRFYSRIGFDQFARLYLRNAREAYVRWGAHGKVTQLDALYPHPSELQLGSAANTIATSSDHLDLATVLKLSQAVSSELVLERVLDALMRAALEHAGAERGLLVLAHGDVYRIEAEAKIDRGVVIVNLRQAHVSGEDLPESILHYVLRTRESVLLHDASGDGRFAADDYIRRRRSRSILCLPLLKHGRLLGVLHLENDLSTHVFTPARISVLALLASEAATSLENGRLYRDLEEREARVRRLVDSNIIGIFIADLDGRIIDANRAFLTTVGYDRGDVDAGRLRWTDLTPPEWRAEDEKHVAEIATKGAHEPYEKEFFRKDGTRVPILLGSALFDDGKQGLAFVLDLTDRKHAEDAARESDRRYHEIRLELSHANRIATAGQLSASITHELNQPLSGILINAGLSLRLLDQSPPNLEGVRESARRTVRDADRATEVIRRLRALFGNRKPTIEPLDLNETIREVVALTASELRTREVALSLELPEGLPTVHGDRVQLQQVMLNLIKNAVDAMSTPGDRPRNMLISTEMHDSKLLVVVRDSGPGVAAAESERIFEAFYSTKSDGLGVGLSICRAIVEAQRGQLWHSPAKPHGAIFQFTLPTSSVV